jgi:nuclear transport factor 2 (NTF2) superfamily protein
MADGIRPPVPPFAREAVVQKVRITEGAWSSRDLGKVAGACTENSCWRSHSEFVDGRLAVRHASLTDLPIREEERKYQWPLGRCSGLSDPGF